MLEANNFTPDLLRQTPSALKRCFLSRKMLKLSIKFIERALHAVASHLFSASNLLNLSSPLLTGRSGPLMDTNLLRELTLFNRSVKSFLRTSDCYFSTSLLPVCKMNVFTVGRKNTADLRCTPKSQTMSMGSQRILVFWLHTLFISFTARSPKIRV